MVNKASQTLTMEVNLLNNNLAVMSTIIFTMNFISSTINSWMVSNGTKNGNKTKLVNQCLVEANLREDYV